ncbi:hypothetical protein IKG13_00105 [Candidatus Saccharibacteria bacterium]|nr:hypothetical protein [Candidatus Saccharibacteria bacterium]
MSDNDVLMKAGADLAVVAINNTASLVHEKIKSIKTNKDLKEQNSELQGIITDLLDDKAELLRIAQIYEQELASQKITDDDIEFITKNIFPILLHFISDDQIKDLNKIKQLLSKEMITILQLVGFNYKKAIGEPLTRLVGSFIESKIKPTAQVDQNQVLMAMIELSKDSESFDRFKEMASWEKRDSL